MMKKSIFAVAVASALTLGAAQAETVLYGSIRYDYENTKKNHASYDEKNDQINFNHKRLSNLEDAGSRIGIKGSEDLGNNNSVIYQLEWGFDGMQNGDAGSKAGFENRLAILGLTGDWGTFTAGRQDNPFKVTIVDDTVGDDFNGSNIKSAATQRAMTSALAGVGIVGGGYKADKADLPYLNAPIIDTETSSVSDASSLTTIQDSKFSRVGKVIAYTTPEFAGFQANAALMMNDNLYVPAYDGAALVSGKNQQKTLDLWTINAKYAYDLGNNAQILAKAGYINGKLADNNSSKMWGLYLGYLSDAFNVTASYANGTHNPQNTVGFAKNADGTIVRPVDATISQHAKNKYQGWDIGASYSFGPNYFSTVRAAYGQNQIKQNAFEGIPSGKDKVKSWAVGFEQKLSTRTRAWVEYGNEETTYNASNVAKQKNNVISVGMRHDF